MLREKKNCFCESFSQKTEKCFKLKLSTFVFSFCVTETVLLVGDLRGVNKRNRRHTRRSIDPDLWILCGSTRVQDFEIYILAENFKSRKFRNNFMARNRFLQDSCKISNLANFWP